MRLTEDRRNPQAQLGIQSMSRREGTARPEDWLSPVDHGVLSKVFGVHLLNQTSSELIILRRQIEKDGVAYEKIAFRPHETEEKRFAVLERYYMQESVQAVLPALTSVMFGASSIEDFGKAKRMSKFSRDPNTGAARSDLLDFQQDEPQLLRQTAAQSLFGMAESEIVRKGIPLMLLHASQTSGLTAKANQQNATSLQDERWSPARPDILKVIRSLAETHVPGQGFIISVEEGNRIEGRKIQLSLQDVEPGHVMATAALVSPTRLIRERYSPEQRSCTRETLESTGDQLRMVDQQQDTYNPPQVGREPIESTEYYIRHLTKLRNQLKSGNFYIKRSVPTKETVMWQAFELGDAGRQILREQVEMRDDPSGRLSGNRKSYLNQSEIEESIIINPQDAHPLSVVNTRIVQHNPPTVYRGEAKQGERILPKSPFDFENALNAFLGDRFEGNYIVSQRIEGNDKVIEKVVISPTGAISVVDKFVLNNLDLIKRLGVNSETAAFDAKEPKPAQSKEFMRLLGSTTDQENLYLVRVVQDPSGRMLRQVLKLLKNLSDPNTGVLARLGSRFMNPQEASRELFPLLQSKGKLAHYLTPNREVEYVVIKESPLESGVGNLKDEVVGYEMTMNPVFKGQLLHLATAPNTDDGQLQAKIDFLNRTLAEKQAEVQRFEAIVRELTFRVNNSSGESESVLQENAALRSQLQSAQRELLATKQEMEELYHKYQKILADLNALLRAREELEGMRGQNQDLAARLSQLEQLYQESLVTIRRLEAGAGADPALAKELDNARREIQRLQTLLLNTEEARGSLENRVASMDRQIKDLQEQVSRLGKERDDLLARLSARPTEDPASKYTEQIIFLERTVTTLKTTISSLEADRDQLKSENQRLKDEIARLKLRLQELELKQISHTSVERVVTQVVSDESALNELRRQNANLTDDNSRLRTELSQLKLELNQKPDRSNSPSKLYLTTVTGIKYGNGGTAESKIVTNHLLDVQRRSGVYEDQPSFEADRDSELYAKYVALRSEFNNLFLENDQLRNENNRLRSDIITLSGQNLTPDLVALNIMPKIVDKSLNERIKRYIDTSKTSHQAIDRLNDQLMMNTSGYHSNLGARDQWASPNRKTRSVSPLRGQDDLGASGLKVRRDEDLRVRVDELEQQVRKKDREIETLTSRVKLITSQADRNIDELLMEVKQLKNKNSSLDMELKGLNQVQRIAKADLERERSREFNNSRMGGSASPMAMSGFFGQTGYMTTNSQVNSVIDNVKSKIDTLVKKIGVMAHELGKIYQSLDNCVVILSDWRTAGLADEVDSLRSLQARAERATDSMTGINYQQEIQKIKGEANDLTLSITRQLQTLVSRLEAINDACKNEITKKASELLSIKNEMDQHDPSKRIPHNLRTSGGRSLM